MRGKKDKTKSVKYKPQSRAKTSAARNKTSRAVAARITSLQEMATTLGHMVFGEVERLRDISSRVAKLEDDLLNDVLQDPNTPFALRLKMYEAVTRRSQNGRQFVLQFVEMLDNRGGFDTEKEEEKSQDVYDIETLSSDQKENLRVALRKATEEKITKNG